MMSAWARAVLGAGLLAGAGCGTVLGIDSDRYVAPSADAAIEVGADAGGPWGCLGQDPEKLDPAFPVSVTVLVMDAIQPSISAGMVDGGSDLDTLKGDGLPGVVVRACAVRDTDCNDPRGTAVTDDAGAAPFRLTGDFAGFFDMRRADLVPATLYPGNLLAGQSLVSMPAYAITPDEFRGLAKDSTGADVSLSPDGGVGHAIVTIYDCQDHQAKGVSVTYRSLGSRGVPFYFNGGLPDTLATRTDEYGLAGAINVPVGTLMVMATLASNGTQVGSASFDVRPGSLTFAWIRVRSR